MSLTIILSIAIVITLGFHFVGVYTNSKKTVWIMLVFVWAMAIGTARNEIKPSGYVDVEKMKNKFDDTDKLIEESMPEISIYEMILIKKSYLSNIPN
jgi:hypothetical protein